MTLSVLGLNHQSAPVSVREHLAHNEEQLNTRLRSLIAAPNIEEALILSTCNRTEFYVKQSHADSLKQWFLEQQFDESIKESHLYEHHAEKAIQHLFRVACGLDSLVIGEPQILGQLKSAYQTAQSSDTISNQLSALFEYAFSVAKKVRSETTIGHNATSVASTAVRLSRSLFGDLNDCDALLIGAGETIELAAMHLAQKNIGKLTVANRRIEKAQALAEKHQGNGVGIPDIPKTLLKADIVISSTASTLPLLGKGMVETALKKRKHRPYFMVDLAVPRDIEPEVGELDDVYLFTIDDLEAVLNENKQNIKTAADDAEAIIHVKTVEYLDWVKSLDANNTLQQLHQMSQELSEEALNKALTLLKSGKTPEEALQFLSHHLCKKILHTPSVQLRDAAADGDHELLRAAHTLFNLKS